MSDELNNSNSWVKVANEDTTNSVNGSAEIVAQSAVTTGGQGTIPEDNEKKLDKHIDEVVEENVEKKIVASPGQHLGGNTLPESSEKELDEGDEKFQEAKRKELKEAVDDIIFGKGKGESTINSSKTTSENEHAENVKSITGGKTVPTTNEDVQLQVEKQIEVIQAGSQVTEINMIQPDEETVIKTESIDTLSTDIVNENVVEELIQASVAVTTSDTTIPKQHREELNKPFSVDEDSEFNNGEEPEIIPIPSPVTVKTTTPRSYKEELNKAEDKTQPKTRLTPSKIEASSSTDKKRVIYRQNSGMSYSSVIGLFVISGVIVASLVSKKIDELKAEQLKEMEKWNAEHATLVTKMSGMDVVTKGAFQDILDKIRLEQKDIQKDIKEKKGMFDQQVLRVKDGQTQKEGKIQVRLEELVDEIAEQNQINKNKVNKEEVSLKEWFESEKNKLMDEFSKPIDTEQGKKKKKDKESSKHDNTQIEKRLQELRTLKEENLKLQYKLKLSQATLCYKCPGKIDDDQHLYKIQEVELEQLKKDHEKEMMMRTMNHNGQNAIKKKCSEELGKLLKVVMDKEETLKEK